ncbi:MAG TPA: sulfatase-like hydrolase/transferase, partial [Candidatus Baltobacteraceae bacterium]|nr:sulfatase-like hydrolase/transferase [Candidatus Baltobacteraceae bacterium]
RAAGYLNNLALIDLELGRIRSEMEASGAWNKTWVIVSADHSWQQSSLFDHQVDYRVPFVIKSPGTNQNLTYSPKINTVLTRDLIDAILRKDISNQQDLASWLDTNGKPLPVYMGNNDN